MSKAFDKVSHGQLLRKLRHYGFGGKLLAWLESSLCNRSRRVTEKEKRQEREAWYKRGGYDSVIFVPTTPKSDLDRRK